MAFRFRYESLLRYRGHLKDKAEIQHAAALHDLMRAEKTLQELEAEYGRALTAFNDVMRESAEARKIRDYADYLDLLKNRTEKGKGEIERLKGVLEIRRKELLECTKQYKVIEALKEKDFEKWRQHQNYLEQKRISEMTILRHGKRYV